MSTSTVTPPLTPAEVTMVRGATLPFSTLSVNVPLAQTHEELAEFAEAASVAISSWIDKYQGILKIRDFSDPVLENLLKNHPGWYAVQNATFKAHHAVSAALSDDRLGIPTQWSEDPATKPKVFSYLEKITRSFKAHHRDVATRKAREALSTETQGHQLDAPTAAQQPAVDTSVPVAELSSLSTAVLPAKPKAAIRKRKEKKSAATIEDSDGDADCEGVADMDVDDGAIPKDTKGKAPAEKASTSTASSTGDAIKAMKFNKNPDAGKKKRKVLPVPKNVTHVGDVIDDLSYVRDTFVDTKASIPSLRRTIAELHKQLYCQQAILDTQIYAHQVAVGKYKATLAALEDMEKAAADKGDLIVLE